MLLTLTLILLANAAPVTVQPSCDFDLDGDVDQSDYGLLQVRLGEVAMPVSRWDLNSDGHIDTRDVEEFCKWTRKPG